jgi:tRNA A-37 threonylcarbamoyl transferase component Bud32
MLNEIPCLYLASTLGQYQAIILEHINQSSLSTYCVESEEEMKLLEASGQLAVDKLHANGVYHGDIRPSNILWSLATRRLVLLDFERSKIFDGKDDQIIKTWKIIDCSDLKYVLNAIELRRHHAGKRRDRFVALSEG